MDQQRKRLYWVWADMLSRCRNPKHKAYGNYGGRGISVCAEWNDFICFERDIGPRPVNGMIDRIDNNAGYNLDNCKWSSRKEQNSNRRSCIYVNDGTERITLREMCRRRNLIYRPIVKRIQDRGWPVDVALSVPVGVRPHFLKAAGKDREK